MQHARNRYNKMNRAILLTAVLLMAGALWIAAQRTRQPIHCAGSLSSQPASPSYSSRTLDRVLWQPHKPLPWKRVTGEVLKRLGFQGNFDEQLLRRMGHVCRRPVFLRRSSPLILLASVPGSGNFWTRFLLEQVTGIYTGTIYNEQPDEYRFGGGLWANSSVAVVKTHSTGVITRRKISQAAAGVILLIRNPFQSAKAEFSRQVSGHTKPASVELFNTRKGRCF